ncbi:hypothetical protein CRG98_012211 [Punica granatum]|uniref:Uncharacterized protein n=1 Tax=Punica granatum TaxID=22663 RepID=A0A2I0KFW2_PUNGR|nr:hypothetical protein CRG98_012211 [Punica granatum]
MGGDRCERSLNCVVKGRGEPPKFGMEPTGEGGAAANCGQAAAWGSSRDLGFEPWLGGLAWLSCGSHSIGRKAGKCLKLD